MTNPETDPLAAAEAQMTREAEAHRTLNPDIAALHRLAAACIAETRTRDAEDLASRQYGGCLCGGLSQPCEHREAWRDAYTLRESATAARRALMTPQPEHGR